MNQKIVAYVPIKLNSERLKNKNILQLNGSPLASYIFNALIKSQKFDEIYVYCSDKRIMDYIPSSVKFLERPTSLDQNTTKGLEIYNSFKNEINADYYFLAHATSPFIKAKSISNAVDSVLNGDFDSAFCVTKHQTFCWYDNQPINYSLSDIPRTQDLQPVLAETSSFFLYSKETINKGRRIGEKPYLVELDKIEGVDIDTEEDFKFAEILSQLIST